MDNVSHPTNVVMETGSVLMAVMNSTAVSICALCMVELPFCTLGRMLPQWTLVETMSHHPILISFVYYSMLQFSVEVYQWTVYLILPTL